MTDQISPIAKAAFGTFSKVMEKADGLNNYADCLGTKLNDDDKNKFLESMKDWGEKAFSGKNLELKKDSTVASLVNALKSLAADIQKAGEKFLNKLFDTNQSHRTIDLEKLNKKDAQIIKNTICHQITEALNQPELMALFYSDSGYAHQGYYLGLNEKINESFARDENISAKSRDSKMADAALDDYLINSGFMTREEVYQSGSYRLGLSLSNSLVKKREQLNETISNGKLTEMEETLRAFIYKSTREQKSLEMAIEPGALIKNLKDTILRKLPEPKGAMEKLKTNFGEAKKQEKKRQDLITKINSSETNLKLVDLVSKAIRAKLALFNSQLALAAKVIIDEC